MFNSNPLDPKEGMELYFPSRKTNGRDRNFLISIPVNQLEGKQYLIPLNPLDELFVEDFNPKELQEDSN